MGLWRLFTHALRTEELPCIFYFHFNLYILFLQFHVIMFQENLISGRQFNCMKLFVNIACLSEKFVKFVDCIVFLNDFSLNLGKIKPSDTTMSSDL